jgi:hypothetical protein
MPSTRNLPNRRQTERRPLALPARLTWKDQTGATRFASVVTRDISDHGVYVESYSHISIPLFRLVQFQLEREARDCVSLPPFLRQARVLSAVYRVTPGSSAAVRQGLALRLMVDPRRRPAGLGERRATA